jgi:hypothetical protein
MCRLFGMSGGPEPARATFWLLLGKLLHVDGELAVSSRQVIDEPLTLADLGERAAASQAGGAR